MWREWASLELSRDAPVQLWRVSSDLLEVIAHFVNFASIGVTSIKCLAQNEWFWAWAGASDEPKIQAVGFLPQHGVKTCGLGSNDSCPKIETREVRGLRQSLGST